MPPVMQQQGASQAAKKQLVWVIQLATSGWTFEQKLQLLYKSGLT